MIAINERGGWGSSVRGEAALEDDGRVEGTLSRDSAAAVQTISGSERGLEKGNRDGGLRESKVLDGNA